MIRKRGGPFGWTMAFRIAFQHRPFFLASAFVFLSHFFLFKWILAG